MKKYSRREIIQKGGRLAANAAIGTTCLPLIGCSVGSENIDSLLPEEMEPADLGNLKLIVLYDNCYYKDDLKVDWGFACRVKSITIGLRGRLADYGATLTEIDEPVMIAKGALSTGAMRRVLIREQGLILLTNRGAILIVGCSHPGIVEMVERARRLTRMEVLLVIGKIENQVTWW